MPETREPHARQQFASLAHQLAGQVVALRGAAEKIHEGMSASDARAAVMAEARRIEGELNLMGTMGVGHA